MIIKDVPILDLRGIPMERVAQIDEVSNVRTVVLDSHNAEAFMRVPRADVRSHLIVEPDEQLVMGQIEFDDRYLGDLADDSHVVLLGQALVDGFTPSLFLRKVRQLRVYGQIVYASPESAGALLSRIERLQGQLLPMSPNAVRWIGTTHLDLDRLHAVEGRPVMSIGPVTIDPQVGVADIEAGITSMLQIGEIKGREEVVCALLAKCRTRLGSYSLSQEQTKPAVHPALRVLQH